MVRFSQLVGTSHAATSRNRAVLGVEAMENRLTPAVAVDPVSRVMTITPDASGSMYTQGSGIPWAPGNNLAVAERDGHWRGYENISQVVINGGPYGDYVLVGSVPVGIPVKIAAGDGWDSVTLDWNRSPVDVYTGSGNDRVQVLSSLDRIDIVNTGDRDTVRVGRDGSMSGIAAPVSVSNDACSPMPSSTDLELDNRSGWRPSSGYGQYGDVYIGSGEVHGMSRGSISYGGNTSLSVWTGSDQRNVSIMDTGGSGVTVNLAWDHDHQRVSVFGTTSPLRINDYGGNTVSIESLQGIRGAVSVYGYSWYSSTDLEFHQASQTSGLITWSGRVRVFNY